MLNELITGERQWQNNMQMSEVAEIVTREPTFPESFLADTETIEVKIQDFLTVAEISKIIQPDTAILAYLSACSSAATVDEELADECLHLAAEFLLLGFTHVIGTLWESDSYCCAEIADKFYEKWLGSMQSVEDGKDLLDPYLVAQALHDAVCSLRDEGYGPLLWGPFIHLGA